MTRRDVDTGGGMRGCVACCVALTCVVSCSLFVCFCLPFMLAFMCLLFVLFVRRLCVSFVCGVCVVCVGVRIHRPRRGSSPKF